LPTILPTKIQELAFLIFLITQYSLSGLLVKVLYWERRLPARVGHQDWAGVAEWRYKTFARGPRYFNEALFPKWRHDMQGNGLQWCWYHDIGLGNSSLLGTGATDVFEYLAVHSSQLLANVQ
jgi:hypothetical protein